MNFEPNKQIQGILLLDKPKAMVSFRLVQILRRKLGVKKIGHAGTLDPFATGVMVMLVGQSFTRLSDTFLHHDKAYEACIKLGESTDTYDLDGQTVTTSSLIPLKEDLEAVLANYQGEILQQPPMFSAKKVGGKKLYELAREGKEIERKNCKVQVKITLLSYAYPFVRIFVECSKGTYIRSIAHDIGKDLGSFGHLVELTRTRSGPFSLDQCLKTDALEEMTKDALAQKLVVSNYLDQN